MPSGRRPKGEHALSNAERQARYRARRQAEQPPPAARPTSHRPSLTRAALARGRRRTALPAGRVRCLYEALPDSLHDTATAEALQAIVELDLETLADIAPPCGFGR